MFVFENGILKIVRFWKNLNFIRKLNELQLRIIIMKNQYS